MTFSNTLRLIEAQTAWRATIDWLRKEVPKRLKKAEDIKMIMAVEGEIWQRFYSMFRYIAEIVFV